VLINFGTLLAQQGRIEEAEVVLREALERDPSYARLVWNNLGIARTIEGDWEGAGRFFEQAHEAGGADADILANLGNVYLALRRPADALARYDEALRHGTARESIIRLGRAVALVRLGRADEGLVEAQEAIRQIPTVPQGWAILDFLATEAGERDLAAEAKRRFWDLQNRPPSRSDLPAWIGG